VVLKSTSEHYASTRPNNNINNILMGTMHLETVGALVTRCYQTGLVSHIDFKPVERFGNRELNAVEGFVYSSEKDCAARANPIYWLRGNYMSKLEAVPLTPN
jgi:hypothetical protein